MAIALVQSKHALATTASLAVTLDTAPTAGNILVACWAANALLALATTPTGFVQAAADDDENLAHSGQIDYRVVEAGDSATVTFVTTTSVAQSACVMEFSGVVTNVPYDKTAFNDPVGTGLSCATGSTGTLAQADELAVGLVAMNNTVTTGQAWDSGFTLMTGTTSANTGYKIVSATTALNPTFSWTTNLRRATGMIVTFKAATVVTATFAAPLGGLTANASAIVAHGAVLAAPLGALTGTSAAAVSRPAVLAAALGSLTAGVAAAVTHPAVLVAPLSALTGTAAAAPARQATLTGPLGALSGTVTATTGHPALLTGPLGALTATAAGTVGHHSVFSAPLGPLNATMTAAGAVSAVFHADLGALTGRIVFLITDPTPRHTSHRLDNRATYTRDTRTRHLADARRAYR